MENIRKHRNIGLVTTEEKYLPTVMKPNFKSGVLFGENLMGCEMGKIKVVMNKPVYLGQAILDLSKIVMYEFHYDYMVLKYGLEKLKLCYMDTDGLEDKKCKGIKKCVVKKTLTFEDYKTCLFSNSTEYRSQLMFKSSKHEVHTIEVNKVTLNRDDDKRISRKHWKNINKSYYENILVFKNHNFSGTIIWLFCRKNQIMIFFYEIINRS